MAALVIDYDMLSNISGYASNLAKKADAYAEHLSRQVQRKFDSLAGGDTGDTASARYYVDAKIKQLNAKKNAYSSLSCNITSLVDHARRVDQQVAGAIARNQENFLKKNEHLRIEGWKADIMNWLVDLKNKCPVFEMIGDAVREIGDSFSSWMDNIKYWYKCEGGKEIIHFAAAIAGAVVAVALFVACIPASGFVAVCKMIAAAIGIVDALTKFGTSYCAMVSARNENPAWAKIYGKQDNFTDWLRQTNFKSGWLNKVSYGAAAVVDSVQLFCDAVDIGDKIGKFKSKFSFIQNYFDKNTGLLSYCKTEKWKSACDYDEFGKIVGIKKVMKVNEYGIVETHFTPKSIWNGIKSFVMDKPLDCHTDTGIRTLLNQNFKLDVKDWKNSFSMQSIKDTFKYRATEGGRISFDEWKRTFNFNALKDTVRYNFKNSSLQGAFAEGVQWKHRRDYIKQSAKTLQSSIKIGQKFESFVMGEYDMAKDIEKTLTKKAKDFFDSTKILDKAKSLVEKNVKKYKSTYTYKRANAPT